MVLKLLEKVDSLASAGDGVVEGLRRSAAARARSMRWPGRKDEAFRFTDLKPLTDFDLEFGLPAGSSTSLDLQSLSLGGTEGTMLATLNGSFLGNPLGTEWKAPSGLLISPLSQLPEDVLSSVVAPALGRVSADLDVFSELNAAAAGAGDTLLIWAAKDVAAPGPIHIVHVSSPSQGGTAARVSSPRLLVIAEEGAEVEVVEEFVGEAATGGGSYWTNAVAEIVVAKGAKVLHGVVQRQSAGAFHIETTAVHQEEGSQYSLIEAQLGGRISRHNVRMKQLGPDTETNMSTISLCGARQLHDLHSSLVLDHPRGVTRQLHKCIVTESTGQGVFDGNVQVNRFAQQTDAGQLTRSLLLAPRGTVNVKPNLQIVADDVKCTHGAAISDLDDEQLFYFQARGIDEATARSALVFSFAAEVVEKFPYSKLRKRLEDSLKAELSAQGAMDCTVAADLHSIDG